MPDISQYKELRTPCWLDGRAYRTPPRGQYAEHGVARSELKKPEYKYVQRAA